MSRRSDGFGGGGIQCFSCGQQGHHIRDCPNKTAGGGPPRMSGGGFHRGPMMPMGSTEAPAIHLGHTAADAQKRIKQLLIIMTPDEQSLARMSVSLLEDIRQHALSEFVATTVLHCVKCLPQKSMLFVGLLAAMRAHQTRSVTPGNTNEEADKFMHGFLDAVSVELQAACKHSRWEELRLLLRFAVGLGLSRLVELSSIWDLLQKLQSFLAAETLPASKREYILYTLFTLVPFLAEEHDSAPFAELRSNLDAQLASRPRRSDLLVVAAAAESSSSSASSAYASAPFSFDLLDCWSSAIGALHSRDAYMNDASEVSIQRASYQCFRTALEKVAPVAWRAADHLALPANAPPRLRPVLRLFPRAYTGFPLNDLLIGDFVSDLLVSFEALHKEGTKQLLALPLPLSDEARQVGQFLLIESLFENLLTLPTTPVRPVYYGTIIVDLFKAQPNLMPPLLGAGVNFLFHHLAQLDVEAVERLLDWFTFHLSNFGYVWPWISWNYVLTQSESHPQRSFVASALALCVRLSYWERIQQVIPEEFVVLMPHQPHPAFRFSTKNIQNTNGDLNIQQYYQFSLELMSIIQGKSTPNAVVQWLDHTVTPALGSEARIRLFTPCILECGNKSYSHLIALLERYKSVFQVLCTTTTKRKTTPVVEGADAAAAAPIVVDTPMTPFDVQRLVLHSLSEYWQHSIQHIIVLVDQFFNFNALSIQSVIGWVFFAQRHPEASAHLWKPILYALLKKALAKLEVEADNIREKPRSMSLTAEKRAADEQAILAVQLEQRDLLAMPIANFQKLLAEALAAGKKASREKDRERSEQDQKAIIGRCKQFMRAFSPSLAPHVAYLQESIPTTSPLHALVAQLPTLL